MIVTVESEEEFMNLVGGSAFTFIGFAPEQKNFEHLEHVLKEDVCVMNPDIEPCFYIWTGAQMNDWNKLVKDPYPVNLHFVALDLSQFNDPFKLARSRTKISALCHCSDNQPIWLDDLYKINKRHESKYDVKRGY